MSAARHAVRGVVLAILIAVPVSADAPRGQYEAFTGGNTQIKDAKTKLLWERVASPTQLSATDAKKTGCKAPARLPTLKELLTLVDEQPHPSYDITQLKTVQKMIDFNAFDGTTSVGASYWTSTPAQSGYTWSVSFQNGMSNADRDDLPNYVRCVTFSP